MKTGDFITTAGIFESTDNPGLPEQIIDLRLSISPSGKAMEMKLHYETRRSVDDSAVYGSGDEPGAAVNVAPGWFCFVERPGTYWTFDGRNSLCVIGHGLLGSPGKSIIQGTFVNRDNPKVPDAVLARLPAKQRELLSPPSEERPSF